jgi:hypothetical protein
VFAVGQADDELSIPRPQEPVGTLATSKRPLPEKASEAKTATTKALTDEVKEAIKKKAGNIEIHTLEEVEELLKTIKS